MTIHNKLNRISEYLDDIKKSAYLDIENLENLVLSKNSNSNFVRDYIFELSSRKLTKIFIVKQIAIFYLKAFSKLSLYFIGYIIFKFFGKKANIDWSQNFILIDVFFLVDNIIKEGKFKENYFKGLYDVLRKYNKNYIFLPRLYGIDKNPFKLINLFNVTNKEKSDVFMYEYELLSIVDIFKLFIFITKYPFKQFKLMQQNRHELDPFFNYELFNVLPSTSFIVYIRYLIGKKIAQKLTNGSKIISWQEFQGIEKSFNKAIKESNKEIIIYGCEFSMTYKTYIGMHITDIDFDLKITPNQTLLNGNNNYSNSKKHIFRNGVSLRYGNLFKYKGGNKRDVKPLALIGYDINEGINILKNVKFLKSLNVKIHPVTSKSQFNKYIKYNWEYICGDLYEAFKGANIVFTPPYAGTTLEAVACGLSVIIVANEDNLTNPLVDYGKGEIWDIAFSEDDVKKKCNLLLEYRKNSPDKVKKIASWYKEKFFIEPTEKNIVKAFELN